MFLRNCTGAVCAGSMLVGPWCRSMGRRDPAGNAPAGRVPGLEIVLVYPFPGHDERWDPKSRERLRHLKENCDQFVMGSKIVGARGYRERTAYMVEHADYLVAVCDDETAGPSGVEAVLRMAKVQKIVVVQICPKTGRIVWK